MKLGFFKTTPPPLTPPSPPAPPPPPPPHPLFVSFSYQPHSYNKQIHENCKRLNCWGFG